VTPRPPSQHHTTCSHILIFDGPTPPPHTAAGMGVSRKISVIFKNVRSNRGKIPSEGRKLTNVVESLVFDG